MKDTVLVAMSGGVDSSVAAALLDQAGYRVIGVTLKLWCYGETAPAGKTCCSIEDIRDARRVAARLGITHYVLDMQEGFEERVVTPFVEAYRRGQTPNPCVECNTHLKFGQLADVADRLGARYVATGHYARRVEEGGEISIRRAVDPRKDQSYVLWGMSTAVRERVLLPVGEMRKDEVRRRAVMLGLDVAAKPDSQDICFVQGGRYVDFVRDRLGAAVEPGPILDRSGNEVGRHQGIVGFTVGQRRGLGVAAREPLYVIAIEPERATVRVGTAGDLERTGLRARRFHWLIASPPAPGAAVEVQTRAGARAHRARITHLAPGEIEVVFDTPVRAVVPGQSAALYNGDRLLGGGVIETGLEDRETGGRTGVGTSPQHHAETGERRVSAAAERRAAV